MYRIYIVMNVVMLVPILLVMLVVFLEYIGYGDTLDVFLESRIKIIMKQLKPFARNLRILGTAFLIIIPIIAPIIISVLWRLFVSNNV